MKKFLLILLALWFAACAPRITSSVQIQRPALPATDFVLVLQENDAFTYTGSKLGTIRSGDYGASTHCSYDDVIEPLKQLARQKGANVIKITRHTRPNHYSSCHRIRADIYYCEDPKAYEKEIEWSDNRKLTWSDFKGLPIEGSHYAAQTMAGLSLDYWQASPFVPIKVKVTCNFDCAQSWVQQEYKNNDYMLAHEQLHFDICEVYARQLRIEINLLRGSQRTPAAIREAFDLVMARYKQRQEDFDRETNHGIDKQKQAEWQKKIDGELAR